MPIKFEFDPSSLKDSLAKQFGNIGGDNGVINNAVSKGKEYMHNTVDFFNDRIDTFKDKYNQSDLISKIGSVAKKVGVSTVYYCLLLYYALLNDKVPASKKVLVTAALGYLISPLDFIPDFLPGGLIDDGTILMFVLSNVSSSIDDEVIQQARVRLSDWFGESEIIELPKLPFK